MTYKDEMRTLAWSLGATGPLVWLLGWIAAAANPSGGMARIGLAAFGAMVAVVVVGLWLLSAVGLAALHRWMD